jgi:hypothetical protein
MSKHQSAGESTRTIAGQWSKSEKRLVASRSISAANKNTQRILKMFAQQNHMK